MSLNDDLDPYDPESAADDPNESDESLEDALDEWWHEDHFGAKCEIGGAAHSETCVSDAFKDGYSAGRRRSVAELLAASSKAIADAIRPSAIRASLTACADPDSCDGEVRVGTFGARCERHRRERS